MDRLIKIALYFVAILNTYSAVLAQNSNTIEQNLNLNETLKVYVNSYTFVSGETLLYKINCVNSFNNLKSNLSKIAYIELLNSNKEIVFKHKLFLENAVGQGDFFIPSSIKTGNYKLIGYTNLMLAKSVDNYVVQNISIINPFIPEEKISFIETNSNDSKTEATNNSNDFISISLNNKQIKNREKATIQIKTNKTINGSFTISVRKKENLIEKESNESNNIVKKLDKSNIINSKNIIPEIRGELIIGKITDKTKSNIIKDVLIALSIPGENFATKIVKTNEKGEFYFNLERPYYSKNVIIQVVSDFRDDYKIELNNDSTIDYSNLTFSNSINVLPNFKAKLIEKSISSQIENAYYTSRPDTLSKIESLSSFYKSIEKDYILDNYTRFPTFKETLIEIVKEMHYTKKNDNYILHLSDYDPNNNFAEAALVLVDGFVIQDINELFQYKASNIYKISIIPGGYYYGCTTFNGVISIITKNKDYETKLNGDFIIKPETLRPLKNKKYYFQNYNNQALYERIPDQRNQLLWIPEIKEISDTSIPFYSSDINGEYEVILEGLTDNGIHILLKEYFDVK